MKIQFGTSRIFLATAAVAIVAGGTLPIWNMFNSHDKEVIPRAFILLSALWLPFVYLAYVLGRRELTLRNVLAFAAVEGLALAYFWMFK